MTSTEQDGSAVGMSACANEAQSPQPQSESPNTVSDASAAFDAGMTLTNILIEKGTFKINHEGGAVEFWQNIIDAVAALSPTPAPDTGEAVRWIIDARFKTPIASVSAGGVRKDLECGDAAAAEAERLRGLEFVERVTVTPLYASNNLEEVERLRARVRELDAHLHAIRSVEGSCPRCSDTRRSCANAIAEMQVSASQALGGKRDV